MSIRPPSCRKMVIALIDRANLRQEDITGMTTISQPNVSGLKNGGRDSTRFDKGFRLYKLYAERVLRCELRLVPIARKTGARPVKSAQRD